MLCFFQCLSLINSSSDASHEAWPYIITAQGTVRRLFLFQAFRSSRREVSPSPRKTTKLQRTFLGPSSILGEIFIKALLHNQVLEKREIFLCAFNFETSFSEGFLHRVCFVHVLQERQSIYTHLVYLNDYVLHQILA